MEKDQEFVDFVVKSLVDHPESVKSERTVDEMGVLISLHLSPEDMGQIIGRQGQTAKALRTLLRVVGAKHKARVNLKIVEPEGGRGPRPAGDRQSFGDRPAFGAEPAPRAQAEEAPDAMEDFKL